MFIIGVEFEVFAHGEQAACKESRGAPLAILAHVIGFGCDIWDQVIRVDRKSSFYRQFVAIPPCELAVFPVEIRAIAIREVKAAFIGKLKVTTGIMRLSGGALGAAR